MTLTLPNVLFCVLAAVTGFSAVAVVVTQNIVRAATWLLFALAGTAGIFFLLGADFLGATQLLIYVGGTLVLVVFGVMLTAQGPFINMRIGAAEWAIAMGVGLVLYGVLDVTLLRPGILAAWLLLFIASVRELGVSIFLVGPKAQVIAPAIVSAWISSSTELSAALALIQSAAVLIALIVLLRAARRYAGELP